MMRKIAAAIGFAKIVRRLCSNTSPTIPTGIVPTISSHAIRSADGVDAPVPDRREEAADHRAQSRRKKMSSATAVATCRPTRNAR